MVSGGGLCEGLIPCPEKSSYQLWFIIVCDLEASSIRWPQPALGQFCQRELFVKNSAENLKIK